MTSCKAPIDRGRDRHEREAALLGGGGHQCEQCRGGHKVDTYNLVAFLIERGVGLTVAVDDV